MDRAFDLTSLQSSLKGHHEYKEVMKLIGRFAAASSFENDLMECRETLSTLSEINSDGAHARMQIGRALMTHAVVMYCRAAIEDGAGRYKICIIKYYTLSQREKHNNVVKLRNKSLAHFDVGEGTYGAVWLSEKAVLKDTQEGYTITFSYRRAHFLAQLCFDLNEISTAALDRAVSVRLAERDLLRDLLAKLFVCDSKFAALAGQWSFDPAAFFSSQGGVDRFWEKSQFRQEVFEPKALTEEGVIAIGPITSTET